MSTHSKKDTKSNMYSDVFGDLSALALDDSGEINSFANEVVNREVVAANWRENLVEFGGDAFRWLKNRGDRDKIKAEQLFKREQATDKVLDAVDKGKYARALKSPQIYHIFEAEIDKQARSIVDKAITSTSLAPVVMLKSAQKEIANAKKLLKQASDEMQTAQQAVTAARSSSEKSLALDALSNANVKADFVAKKTKEMIDNANAVIAAHGATQAKADSVVKLMEAQRKDLEVRAKNLVTSAINKGQIYTENNDLIINIKTQLKTKGLPDVDVQQIKLNRADFERRVDELKIKKTDTAKEYAEVQKRIDSRPKPTKGQVGQDKQGRKYVFNGVKWILLAGATATVWQNKDRLPDIVDSFKNDNSTVDVGQQPGTSPSSSSSPTSAYDLNDSHDSSSAVMKNVNPGGANPAQVPKAYGQDAWDKLKSPSSSQRRKFESDDDDGWWNAPTNSNPTYDDMGYVGSADESWVRNAQRMSLDELDDEGLNNYGADQVVAAQNFLAYYGLGTGKQPGEQIIPSLLMGNFDGMSFDEYRQAHSEEETRQAMQRFEKGLSMFSEEMTKLASNLESFYTERQRRIEGQSPNQPAQAQKPNEEPQRAE